MPYDAGDKTRTRDDLLGCLERGTKVQGEDGREIGDRLVRIVEMARMAGEWPGNGRRNGRDLDLTAAMQQVVTGRFFWSSRKW